MHRKNLYAIKTQWNANNAPIRGFWVPWPSISNIMILHLNLNLGLCSVIASEVSERLTITFQTFHSSRRCFLLWVTKTNPGAGDHAQCCYPTCEVNVSWECCRGTDWSDPHTFLSQVQRWRIPQHRSAASSQEDPSQAWARAWATQTCSHQTSRYRWPDCHQVLRLGKIRWGVGLGKSSVKIPL